MHAIHTLVSRVSRRRDGLRTKTSPRRLWLWTAISIVALSAPAWADEQPRVTSISLLASVPSPASGGTSVTALFGEHDAVGQKELATQRGGAAFSVPIAQTGPQTGAPHIILWDELKSQAPVAPAGQGTNRINIQVR
jgi:hypothetical protein